jgi:LmbE family N-acetylglucosaminyl deacetylase
MDDPTHPSNTCVEFGISRPHGEDRLLLGRTLVLVAHPDDEAIGCGALFARMSSSVVVFATDGAPRDAVFWQEYGSREAYAQIRREEALRVASFAGVDEIRFLADGIDALVDQELARNLPAALDELRKIVMGTRPATLLTLAYEGGHPDHDCCNFITSIVAHEFHLPTWEMPLYHRSADGETRRQHFLARRTSEFIYQLSQLDQKRKQDMLDLYHSQRAVLKEFSCCLERFRMLPAYDYCRPPHRGLLNYEAWAWGINGGEVAAAFCACMKHAAAFGGFEEGAR